MPKYKLIYFNLCGRAEPIRWIFAAANQSYEDERLERQKEWPIRRKEIPYEKIPVLYIDGKPLSQSVAICRYLGKQFDLSTDDGWLASVGDEVADAVHDLIPHAAKFVYAKVAGNIEESKKILKEFNELILKPTMVQLEEKLKDHQWFCGDKMTWVDIYAACYLSQLSQHNEEAFNSYPSVKQHFERVVALPQIQTWLRERPVTTH